MFAHLWFRDALVYVSVAINYELFERIQSDPNRQSLFAFSVNDL